MNAKHTPEPWMVDATDEGIPCVKDAGGAGIVKCIGENCTGREDAANAARIVSCVNALAGVADPEATIKAAREALAGLLPLAECYVRDHQSHGDRLEAARRALALLGMK